MARIETLARETATSRQQNLLEAVEKRFGVVPNLYLALAHSPATLEAHLGQVEALADGLLEKRLREQIAVVVAGTNQCDYCASAHTALAQNAGVSAGEAADNLHGRAGDPETAAVLAFVQTLVRERGRVTTADLAAVRDAGFSTGEIVEIVAHVGMNVFTNYFNHVAETDVDFPRVHTVPAPGASA